MSYFVNIFFLPLEFLRRLQSFQFSQPGGHGVRSDLHPAGAAQTLTHACSGRVVLVTRNAGRDGLKMIRGFVR